MAIRKPSLSVSEARHLAETRSDAAQNSSSSNLASSNSVPAKPTKSPAGRPQDMSEKINEKPVVARSGSTQQLKPATSRRGESRDNEEEVPSRTAVQSSDILNSRVEKAQVYLCALLPAQGVSPVFEMLCRQYPPQKALQMVLRRAFQEYETMLENGSFKKAHETYAVDGKAKTDDFVQTSRMMPKNLLGIARAHFDPLGLESTRSFGRKLASAALANFFARENGGK